jgi:hypothetical protein
VILAEMLFQNPCRADARKLLISWIRGNQIVSLQNQVILEDQTEGKCFSPLTFSIFSASL